MQKLPKKILYIVTRFIGWLLLGLLLIFGIVAAALQSSNIQTWAVGKITSTLSQKLNTEIKVEGVDIEFFKTAVLENIFIADLRADTLLAARTIKVNIGLLDLLGSEIHLNSAEVNGAIINLHRLEKDSAFNYQFLIEAFASPTPTDTTSSGFSFGVGEVTLNGVHFNMKDEREGRFNLNAYLGNWTATTDVLDFEKQRIALDEVQLVDSDIIFQQLIKDSTLVTKELADTSALSFPSFGWDISANQIRLLSSRVAYSNENIPRLENALDFSHLDLENLTLPIDGFRHSDEMILGKIKGASFEDHSGFQLKELSADVEIHDTLINLADLLFRTPKSDFKNDTRLTFSKFGDLSDFLNEVKVESKFGESQLAISDLLMLAPAVQQIPNLNFPSEEMLTLRGGLFLENENLSLDQLHFAIGKTTKLDASGIISQLTGNQLIDVKIEELQSNYASLQKFTKGLDLPPGLENFGTFRLSGGVVGTLENLMADNIRLTTEADTRFAGNLKITGLPDVNSTIFDLEIKDLASRSSDLTAFTKEPLPPQIERLGLVQFIGDFKGTPTDFLIDGTFKTEAGIASTDLDINFTDDYSDATYNGRLGLQNFDIGRVLGDTSQLEKVTLNTRLSGSGLNLDNLNTNLEGIVESTQFNGYEYKNITVEGRLDQRQFSGQFGMDDPNLRFDFLGVANLNDSIPDFEFNLSLDTANLAALNFYPNDLGLSGKLNARLRGSNLDNLDGHATLTNFAMANTEKNYFDEKITLVAEQLSGGKRRLDFEANFLQARVEGQYKFADLPALIVGYVDDFFPVEELATPTDSLLPSRQKFAEQNFDFEMHFVGLPEVASLFIPGFTSLDSTAYIRGSFDSDEQNLNLKGVFPDIVFNGIKLDTFRLSANGNVRHLQTDLALRQMDVNGGFFANQINLNTHLEDDIIRFDLALLDDSLGQDFRLAGQAAGDEKSYHLRFDRTLVLNKEEWEIDRGNSINFSNKKLNINDLTIRKNLQNISVASVGEAPIDDIAPLEIHFDNFRLSEISGLLNNPNLVLAGGLNGSFTVKEPQTNLHYNADLTVDSLGLNEQLLGQLNVRAEQPRNMPTIDLSVALTGANEMSLSGEYNVSENRFDLKAELERLDLVVIDPFMVGLIEKSTGFLSGNFSLKGTPEQPILRGTITSNDVSTVVSLAGTRFSTDGGNVDISEKEIDLGRLTLADPLGREAILSGKVTHDYFDNFRLALRAQSNGMRVLNTNSKDNQLYWGDIVASADVQITGTTDEPSLDITATTLDSTNLHVQPLIEDLAVVQEDYIIFADPAEYERDSLQILKQKINTTTGIDLSLLLQVTPVAELNVIIDPATGDQLFCRGNAELIVKMDPAGNLDITGRYVIEEGQYSFAYEGLVKRDFRIQKGSSITFTGDPLDARFDITAIYDTRATTYELIANESSLGEATLAGSRRRTDVEVLLNIDGDLDEPEITFDIGLPQNQGGAVDNLVSRKLVSLREEPNAMNKQVFSLLLFNSFLASESGAGLATIGENVALSSVSNLVSSQLNRLAGRYLKGVDLSLGFESYRAAGEDENTVSELQVGLSKQLFNDRLTIRVGGNFNLENSQSSEVQEGGSSAIAGDFVLEYKLTEQGNYLLKVFHKSDYNILLDANTNKTGVGIMYRKSY